MKKTTIILVMLALLLLVSHDVSSNYSDFQSITDDYYFRRSWGGEVDIFSNPFDVAVSPDGVVYVVDRALSRVISINQKLRTYALLGGPGNNAEDFSDPTAVAVGISGKIYVTDYSGLIMIFSPDGELENYWGTPYGGFLGLSIDSEENIYTTSGNTVLKFSPEGQLLMELTGGGSLDTTFKNPWGIALDQDDNIYVSDSSTYRIQKYNKAGELILIWGSKGAGQGQFNYPTDIAFSSAGYIFVVDTNNNRIQRFDLTGNYISEWQNLDFDNSDLAPLNGIGTDRQGKVYLSHSSSHNVQVLTGDLSPVISYGSPGVGRGEFFYPSGLGIDADGNIFVIDMEHRVQKFSETGTLLIEWDGVSYPESIAVDKVSSLVFVADINGAIHKFTPEGLFIEKWQVQHENHIVEDLVVDSEGNLHLLIKGFWPDGDPVVQTYDENGTLLLQWGCLGTEPGCFDNATGIGIDSHDHIYVTESYGENDRVQKFEKDGTFLTEYWSLPTTVDVDVDPEGRIYLVSYLSFYYPPITRITPPESYEYYPYLGHASGELYHPEAIAINYRGNLIIIDSGNSRIVELSKGLPEPHPYYGLALNGGFESWPPLNEWTYGGELSVSRSSHAIQGYYSLQLGNHVAQTEQGLGESWAYSNFYVPPEFSRPLLTFKYNMFVNDIMDYSDFFVAIQDGVGLNHLATVLTDGFQPCSPGVPPSPGRDLGWRSVTYDLSAYKGEHVRLVFSNRNLWPDSWGIWTYVDDVRVVDAGPLPLPIGSNASFLPMVQNTRCDPVY